MSVHSGDIKLVAVATGNIAVNTVHRLITEAQPILAFILVILQLIAAASVVWHIVRKYLPKKNEKAPPSHTDSP
jgi:hypothetical protein